MENKTEENKQPTPILSSMNEMKPINSGLSSSVSIEKYKLELEQRVNSYFLFNFSFKKKFSLDLKKEIF